MLYFSKSSSIEQSIARNNESFHVFSQRLPQNNLLANVNLNIYAMLAQHMQIHYKIILQKSPKNLNSLANRK